MPIDGPITHYTGHAKTLVYSLCLYANSNILIYINTQSIYCVTVDSKK